MSTSTQPIQYDPRDVAFGSNAVVITGKLTTIERINDEFDAVEVKMTNGATARIEGVPHEQTKRLLPAFLDGVEVSIRPIT